MGFAPFIMSVMAQAQAAPPAAPTTRTYLGRYYSGNNTTAFTFNNVAFGTASANRKLVLLLSTGTPQAPTTLTIGGIAATMDYNFPGNISWINWNAFSAVVPTGTSGTVVMNYATANWNHPTFSIYSVLNSAGVPAFYSAAGNDVSGSVPVSVTLNAPAGGVLLAGARDATAFTSGATLDNNLSEYYQWAFGSAAPPAGSVTVGVNRDPAATAGGSNVFAATYV